jgi:hypothetical protein
MILGPQSGFLVSTITTPLVVMNAAVFRRHR